MVGFSTYHHLLRWMHGSWVVISLSPSGKGGFASLSMILLHRDFSFVLERIHNSSNGTFCYHTRFGAEVSQSNSKESLPYC